MTHSNNPESGNILIYVIIAIFLFGALIAVLRGGGTQQNIDPETLILKVTEARQYTAELERGVQFILSQGHSENEIRFAHPNHSSAYGDLSADAPFTRQMFHSSGGNVTWQDNDTSIQSVDTEWTFVGLNCIPYVGTGATCTSRPFLDLMAILPYVTQDFCIAVNDAIGVDNPSGSPPQDLGSSDVVSPFDGNEFTGGETVQTIQNMSTVEGCYEGGGTPATGTYHYYRAILAR